MIICGAALESSSLLLSLLPPLVQTEKKRQHFSWCRLVCVRVRMCVCVHVFDHVCVNIYFV